MATTSPVSSSTVMVTLEPTGTSSATDTPGARITRSPATTTWASSTASSVPTPWASVWRRLGRKCPDDAVRAGCSRDSSRPADVAARCPHQRRRLAGRTDRPQPSARQGPAPLIVAASTPPARSRRRGPGIEWRPTGGCRSSGRWSRFRLVGAVSGGACGPHEGDQMGDRDRARLR